MTGDLDDAYRPLSGPEQWEAAGSLLPGAPWEEAVEGLRALDGEAPAWTDMVRRGMVVAAAYWSGALAGLYDGDDVLAGALLAGVATPASCGPGATPHVLANHAASELAAGIAGSYEPLSEARLRRLHAVACAPQLTHPVPTDGGGHDHVLGHGDYKHHPNDPHPASGCRQVLAPVGLVGAEMARLASALAGGAFAALRPTARAAYALHGLTHVGPFAAGNGRVGRAVASGTLLAAASVPFAVPAAAADRYRRALAAAGHGEAAALVAFVEQQCAHLVALVSRARTTAGSPAAAAALRRWKTQVRTAHRVRVLLPAAVEGALLRHRRRTDLGWMDDLVAARVVAGPPGEDEARFEAGPVAIRVPAGGESVVEEAVVVVAHPVAGEDHAVAVQVTEAELGIHVHEEDVAPLVTAAFTHRLDALLDRAVTALAVRVAAEDDAG
ncbi:MAG TPA: Fic family protein [Acidimicrobiales bacterium]|nr:Fic family protein [Acidimicrobiales bacterium]